ncbi:WRKY transcription factor [Hibiscus syriacus]|uniref:Protein DETOXIFICATION n=1 Tax=Hibiscus syriacus TaxID=106335 RepID=A0A6A2XSW0_HIBSY|nr:WRKY transcription factor [Hibiscus syriacus]
MYNPKPASPTSSFLPPTKSLFNKTVDLPIPNDDGDELRRLPTLSEALEEIKAIGKISGPTAISSLLLYSRAMISMLFLGYLGELELAGGSLAIGVANITGYSVISGLAMGMEPICGQAYGAKQWKILGLTLQRTVLLLLSASIPISFMWAYMKTILLWTQSIMLPVTYCSAISVVLHVPLNYLLVFHFKLGVAGVAVSMVWTNFNVFLFLSSFLYFSGVYKDSWVTPSTDCLKGWSSLLALAVPTCASVCLEWWWYEFMILMCGLLVNPKATIASMGILIQTTSLVYCFPSALSVGVSTRVGNELGANRPGKARISMIVSLVCAVSIGLLAMLFTTLMRHQWGKLFTKDTEILELTAVALPVAGLCELGNCPQTTGCGVLRGSARPTTGANINLGSFYLVGMPVAILMGFVIKMGFAGLWLGLLAAQASCASLMLVVLWKTDWRVEVDRARVLTQTSNNKPVPPLLISANHKETNKKKNKGDLEDIILCINDELVKLASHETRPLLSTS